MGLFDFEFGGRDGDGADVGGHGCGWGTVLFLGFCVLLVVAAQWAFGAVGDLFGWLLGLLD
ncbi:hypothetical protein AB0E83_23760 [Streptomyces sp. NPDC035033]|uniref:hypothetical protein n=1 Tax=Streptomyces sp. NPDC035033 TaxID=3155368 RepID=UPI0033D66D7B